MSCTPPLLAKRISWRIYKEYEKKGYIVQRIAHTTTDSAFCPGSKLVFVPVLEPGQGFRAFVPGGRTGTKGA